MPAKLSIIPVERIERSILVIRGQRVILDAKVAALYDVEVKRLNEAVRRNRKRFPPDFMFQLSALEFSNLRSQSATSSSAVSSWGGRRHLPLAFTEQGVAMLSSVLSSERAIQVNIEIVRAFVRLRLGLHAYEGLARRIRRLEKRYDSRFRAVFDALRDLVEPREEPRKRRIGFHAERGVVA